MSHASFHDLHWDGADPTGVKQQGRAESCKKDTGAAGLLVVFLVAPSFRSRQQPRRWWQPVAGSPRCGKLGAIIGVCGYNPSSSCHPTAGCSGDRGARSK